MALMMPPHMVKRFTDFIHMTDNRGYRYAAFSEFGEKEVIRTINRQGYIVPDGELSAVGYMRKGDYVRSD